MVVLENFEHRFTGLREHNWYFGKVSDKDCEKLLEGQVYGTWIVTKNTDFIYRLVVVTKDGKIAIKKINCDEKHVFFHETLKSTTPEGLLLLYTVGGYELPDLTLGKPLRRSETQEIYDNIEMGRTLGSGHFGLVVEGNRLGKDGVTKVCAVKTLKNTATKLLADELILEGNIMKQLNHKNILNLISIIEFEKPPALVMDLCDQSLVDQLKKKIASIGEKCKWTKDTACGLTYLRQQNVLHRDLAARNIMLFYGIVKISDFGLSCTVEEASKRLMQTIPIRGAAPELIRTKIATFQSELWAFGIVMYEIYSNGATPYGNLPTKEVKAQVLAGKNVLELNEAPVEVTAVFAKCLSSAPEERGSIDDHYASLKRFYAATYLDHESSGKAQKVNKRAKRREGFLAIYTEQEDQQIVDFLQKTSLNQFTTMKLGWQEFIQKQKFTRNEQSLSTHFREVLQKKWEREPAPFNDTKRKEIDVFAKKDIKWCTSTVRIDDAPRESSSNQTRSVPVDSSNHLGLTEEYNLVSIPVYVSASDAKMNAMKTVEPIVTSDSLRTDLEHDMKKMQVTAPPSDAAKDGTSRVEIESSQALESKSTIVGVNQENATGTAKPIFVYKKSSTYKKKYAH